MRLFIATLLLILISAINVDASPAHSLGNAVQYELINGKWYKVIHQITEDKVIIYYFASGDVPQGKYTFAGAETLTNGKVTKDTFKANDR